jgi:hypothetical protein
VARSAISGKPRLLDVIFKEQAFSSIRGQLGFDVIQNKTARHAPGVFLMFVLSGTAAETA